MPFSNSRAELVRSPSRCVPKADSFPYSVVSLHNFPTCCRPCSLSSAFTPNFSPILRHPQVPRTEPHRSRPILALAWARGCQRTPGWHIPPLNPGFCLPKAGCRFPTSFTLIMGVKCSSPHKISKFYFLSPFLILFFIIFGFNI